MFDDGEKRDDGKSPAWLVSFGDVTALMLTFFVMMFAMSSIQSEKWDAVISLLSTSRASNPDTESTPSADSNIPTVEIVNALPTEYLDRVFKETLSKDPILASATISRLDGVLVISLPSENLFAPGKATLLDGADEAFFRLGGVLSKIGNQVEVVGHTDRAPPESDAYPSNWELSLARSETVAGILKKVGYSGSAVVLGAADGQYRHIDTRIPEEKRNALARRVDIVIRPDAGGQ